MANDTPIWMQDELDDLQAIKRAGLRSILRSTLIGIFILAGVGCLPLLMGLGFFGWKTFRYQQVDLFFVNITGEEILLEINGRKLDTFSSGRVHSTRFLAGQVRLRTINELDGRVVDEQEFHTDNRSVFYSIPGSGCYAVMDVSDLYRGSQTQRPLRLVGRLFEEDRLYILPTGPVVRPRGVVPDQAPGGVAVTWVEDVACELLRDENEDLLLMQQMLRLTERRERRQALREAEQR